LNGITDSDDIKTKNRDSQEEMELRMSASPRVDGEGNTTGGIEVSLDVTLENQMTTEVEQAAEQISSSVEELSSSAEEVSASSENIASTQQQLSKGSAEQVMAITETQRKFGDLSKGIRTIREKVENIGQVADLIKGIASQTNMLALNAAIEAARAGEAGRGFNVVADQVRKLADESRNAVANTEEMLAEIDVISKQQEGGALEILKAIDNIATIAEESSSSTEEAASAAEEQASSMEQITSSAQTMANIVQRLEALLEASKKGKGGTSGQSTRVETPKEESDSEKKQIEKEIVVEHNQSNTESAF
jgi:methyl-accepting chemotaxis protein